VETEKTRPPGQTVFGNNFVTRKSTNRESGKTAATDPHRIGWTGGIVKKAPIHQAGDLEVEFSEGVNLKNSRYVFRNPHK
jgi:hypothetical protein